jgi:hypothetical protein
MERKECVNAPTPAAPAPAASSSPKQQIATAATPTTTAAIPGPPSFCDLSYCITLLPSSVALFCLDGVHANSVVALISPASDREADSIVRLITVESRHQKHHARTVDFCSHVRYAPAAAADVASVARSFACTLPNEFLLGRNASAVIRL